MDSKNIQKVIVQPKVSTNGVDPHIARINQAEKVNYFKKIVLLSVLILIAVLLLIFAIYLISNKYF